MKVWCSHWKHFNIIYKYVHVRESRCVTVNSSDLSWQGACCLLPPSPTFGWALCSHPVFLITFTQLSQQTGLAWPAPRGRFCLPPLSMAFSRFSFLFFFGNRKPLATILRSCGNTHLVVGFLLTSEDSFYFRTVFIPPPERTSFFLVRWCSGFKHNQKSLQETRRDFFHQKYNCNS